MKSLALATTTLLLFATTATAEHECVAYLSGVKLGSMAGTNYEDGCEESGCEFTSLNPRNKDRILVAKVPSVPTHILWRKDGEALTYELNGQAFLLEWKRGASPIQLPEIDRSAQSDTPEYKAPSQQGGRVWNPGSEDSNCERPEGLPLDSDSLCRIAVAASPHREIQVGSTVGCILEHFIAPVAWVDRKTGEKKVLYDVADAEHVGGFNQLAISTADTFILIGSEYHGYNGIVADLNSGETHFRLGTHSMLASWAACPSK